MPGRRRASALAAGVLAVALAASSACGGGDAASKDGAASPNDADAPDTSASSAAATTANDGPAYPLDDTLRLNDIQALGSHNSYHVEPEPDLLAGIRGFSAPLADSFEYTHLPLTEQFDTQGIRQIELDVFADPDGGRYARRALAPLVGLPAESDDPAMARPGFKVLHVQDVDFGTTCSTFVACLEEVRAWSGAHPGHVPIMILVEAKDDPVSIGVDLGFAVPPVIDAAELDALDAEIRSVFSDDQLLTPDDVRGGATTLEEAILTGGWPTLGEVRGQVLFALDNEDDVRDAYLDGHPGLEDRAMFASGDPGDPWAAFVKRNDAVGSQADIEELVGAGYVVRTRADSDTNEARTGDTTVRDAALASGAQWVSTDYPVADADFDTGYLAEIPDGTPARCNPARAPDPCEPTDIENPSELGG
jgi:hypothetical protein